MAKALKNLANCTPREFIRQTAKIRHAAKAWLTLTDIMNIRKRLADVPDTASSEDRARANNDQAMANLNAMLDAILDEHPDETIELLGLCCFIEPEDIDRYSTEDLLYSVTEMLGSKAVIGFFTSLASLGKTGIVTL